MYVYRRQQSLKRIANVNFDNPVYKRGAEAVDQILIHRDTDYIDIAINETQVDEKEKKRHIRVSFA